MKNRSIILVVSVIIMLTQNLWAGATGKINGTVIDSETKEPLPGAIVNLLGTATVAHTDMGGIFIMEKIPAGNYSVQAKMTGYKRATKTNVKIIVDYTMTVNFKLIPTTIEMENTIVTEDGSIIKVVPDSGNYKILSIKENERLTRVKSSKDNTNLSQNTGHIMGVVIDDETKQAMPGTFIALADSDYTTSADSNGVFCFFNVLKGTYTVNARMMGYVNMTFNNVRIGVDSTVILNINLIPACICFSGSKLFVNIDSQVTLSEQTNSTLAMYRLNKDFHNYNCKDTPWNKVNIHRRN